MADTMQGDNQRLVTSAVGSGCGSGGASGGRDEEENARP